MNLFSDTVIGIAIYIVKFKLKASLSIAILQISHGWRDLFHGHG